MEIKRRDFVKLIGASLAGLAVGSGAGAVMKLPKSMEPVLYSGPRIESWKLTACSKCPGSCSLKIRLIDNFPIQAFGNPLSPINEGGICSMGLASIADLYHPARLTGPVKKINGKFVSISYKEAYKILLDELKKVISENGQDDIFIIAQTESRIRANLFQKFSKGTGIKNLIVDSFLNGSSLPYLEVTDKAPGFIDFEKCDYILNFGAQLTEISQNPLYYTRKVNEYRAKGYSITAVQPKLTPDVSKSDDWIPIQPAAYGDLALGIAYVLLKDDQYDKNAEKNISGFGDFKKYVLDNYIPEKVQESTGVPSEVILQAGRNFEKASAPAAFFDESILYNSNGTQNALAIIALNALKGFRGFGKIKDHFFSSILKDEQASNADVTYAKLKERLGSNKGIQILISSGSNFVFNNAEQDAVKKQLGLIPFIVSFSSFIDETSANAHLVIPDHNDFEKLDLLLDESTGKTIVTVQQPIVNTFFNTTDTGDLLISLMKELKPDIKIQYGNYSDYIKQIAKKLYSNSDGILMNQNKPTAVEKGLRKIGWQTAQYGSFDDFWDSLLESGGWWNPFADKESYYPKVDFKQTFHKGGMIMNSSASSSTQNKFHLNIFRKNLDYKGSMSLYPVLVEQFGHNWSVFYELWAEINPETALSQSLRNRSKVMLKTNKGKFPAVLIYNPAVMPGNIDVPFGLGHTIFGDTCGVNPLSYSDNVYDKLTGKPSFSETLVEIESASTKDPFFSAKTMTDQKELPAAQRRSIYA